MSEENAGYGTDNDFVPLLRSEEHTPRIFKSISVSSYTTLLEKYPTFFCENLVDIDERRLHEATFNLFTQT